MDHLSNYLPMHGIKCSVLEQSLNGHATQNQSQQVLPIQYLSHGYAYIYTRSRITRNFKCGTFDLR